MRRTGIAALSEALLSDRSALRQQGRWSVC
jgi:hypothetical protein